MSVHTIVILGGYGNFGKRIAENLCQIAGIRLIIAGRNADKAGLLCDALRARGAVAVLEPAVIDVQASEFIDALAALQPDLVIHTSGPFQGQDDQVPRACLTLRCHYIDLADDRRFVCDIRQLDQQARESGVLLVSGASSVPGLSSTVIDHFTDQFGRLDEIDCAIAPGNQAERGEATVRGILSYTGHPFPVWEQGAWTRRYGWMSARRVDFGPLLGKRWLANVDIPDLELFPERYPSVRTVRFQAGLELGFMHLGMVAMAALTRIGLVRDWSRWTRTIVRASEWFIHWGTDDGGMQVLLSGLDTEHAPLRIRWLLSAQGGIGPYIPTLSTLILARKLIDGPPSVTGAMPCLGLYTLAEFDQIAQPLGIHHSTEVRHG